MLFRSGFTKFIIVVPSIAIKEGVYKSFQITEEHFKLRYDNDIYNYFVYDSSKLTQIQTFATSSNIEIMIINIDSFRKSFDGRKQVFLRYIIRTFLLNYMFLYLLQIADKAKTI